VVSIVSFIYKLRAEAVLSQGVELGGKGENSDVKDTSGVGSRTIRRRTEYQLLGGRRSGQRLRHSAMAGVARNMHFAVGEFRVEVFHHGEHHARRNLHRFIVSGPVACDVAIVAHHAEASGRVTHGARGEFSFGKNFQVCVGGTSAASAASTATASCGRGILGEKGCGAYREYKE
jgi:hypothetical protein